MSGDTIESLDAELQRQKRINAKVLDLLGKINAAFSNERVGPMIDEARRTKEMLDDAGKLLEEKRQQRGTT